MKKTWIIKNEADERYKLQFKEYDDIVVQMLYNRGIKNKNEAEEFFDPQYEGLLNPFLLKDMDKAVKRIIEALDKNQNIVIFGDYDVDGITATAVVYKILEKLKAKVSFYIPHRINEGYGLNKKAIDFLVSKKTNLIITVDNGISNKEEVSYAKKKGVDIIITDHHEVPKVLPSAIAVVNPKRPDSKYPFRDLAGVGVAFKLVNALVAEINKKKKKEVISEGHLKWYLDLVALGTISDIVPLIGENRIITNFGLIVLTKSKNIGLRSLEKVAGIELKNGSPYMVGFQIAPRLNAAGRMAHAATALELLLTEDEGEAGVLAMKLDKLNRERQESISENISSLKKEFIGKSIENIILLKNEKWTAGIIGLIAGRISEEYGRPVFCMAEEGGIIKGSVRSSVELNVIETLAIFEKTFISFGGHKGAGGFSLKTENYELFEMQVLQYGRNKIKDEELSVALNIEKQIEFKDISPSLYKEIKKFEPFGSNNEEPIFLTQGVKVKEAKKVGKESTHTKLKLTKDGKEFSAILFNHGEMGDKLYYGKEMDIVYKLSENEWRDKKTLELKIEDLK